MSNVTRIRAPDAHSLRGVLDHALNDKPVAGIFITRVGDGWEWRYYGDVMVSELVGALEMVKHDLLCRDWEQS